MGESLLAKDVRLELLETCIPMHISFIESPETSPGIPDMNIAVKGKEVFVELKCYSKDHRLPEIRPSQVRWFKKRTRVGVKAFLLAELFNKIFMLIPGKNVGAAAKSVTSVNWTKLSQKIWSNKVDWKEFINEITKE